jgi:hypothetical protein
MFSQGESPGYFPVKEAECGDAEEFRQRLFRKVCCPTADKGVLY